MNESPSKTGTWKCKHMQHINKYKSININSFHVFKNSEQNCTKKKWNKMAVPKLLIQYLKLIYVELKNSLNHFFILLIEK